MENQAGREIFHVTASPARSALSHPRSLLLAPMPPCAVRAAAGRPSPGQDDHLVQLLALYLPDEEVPKQPVTAVRVGWAAEQSP